jgi:hypothetical protein
MIILDFLILQYIYHNLVFVVADYNVEKVTEVEILMENMQSFCRYYLQLLQQGAPIIDSSLLIYRNWIFMLIKMLPKAS